MIKVDDLHEAIAECQGERNPNANTCMRLAAFYTILDHIDTPSVQIPTYSYAAGNDLIVDYDGESEFAQTIKGMSQDDLWPIVDEFTSAVQALQPKLYAAFIRKIKDVKAGD